MFVVSVCLLGVSVSLCFCGDIWYDELFTTGLANSTFSGLISLTARDVHPPLYYMVVKLFFLAFGSGRGSISQAIIAKLASTLPFFLCLLYAITKVRKHFGMLAAGLFSFLLVTMPQMAGYTVEMRMYGYALFFVTAGMLHAYGLVCYRDIEPHVFRPVHAQVGGRVEKRGHRLLSWAALTLYCLAACYTHYFACVAAMMIYVYLFFALAWERRLKKEGKAFLVSGLVCTLSYIPWLWGAVAGQVRQVNEDYWIQPLSWRSLGGCAKFVFQPSFASGLPGMALAVVFFLIFLALLAMLLAGTVEKGQAEKGEVFFAAGCVGVLAGLLIFGFLASFLIRPVFVYRYMLPALGVFWLAFAIMASRVKGKKYVSIPLLLFLLVIGLWDYRAFYGEEMWKRVQMAGAQEAFSQIGKEDTVVCNFDQAQAVVSYYLPNDTYLWYGEPESLIREMYPHNHALVEGGFSDEAGIAALTEALEEGDTVWFIGSGKARDEIIEKWGDSGIKAEERASTMVERYWFNLYRISLEGE